MVYTSYFARSVGMDYLHQLDDKLQWMLRDVRTQEPTAALVSHSFCTYHSGFLLSAVFGLEVDEEGLAYEERINKVGYRMASIAMDSPIVHRERMLVLRCLVVELAKLSPKHDVEFGMVTRLMEAYDKHRLAGDEKNYQMDYEELEDYVSLRFPVYARRLLTE